VRELLANGQTGPGLVSRITGEVAAARWSDAGGAGVVIFDPPSQCLLILQSQPVHAAVQKLLAQL